MLLKINQRGIIQKRNKEELLFLCTALRVIARACIPCLESFGFMMTKLRSWQGKRDDADADTNADADADADAADQSYTCMSPFQATQ